MASNSSKMTAVNGGTGTTSTPANNVDGNTRRRSSQSSGLFSGLMSQKRDSTDMTANARRQSFADQKPAAGVIGQMWHNFMSGNGEKK